MRSLEDEQSRALVAPRLPRKSRECALAVVEGPRGFVNEVGDASKPRVAAGDAEKEPNGLRIDDERVRELRWLGLRRIRNEPQDASAEKRRMYGSTPR